MGCCLLFPYTHSISSSLFLLIREVDKCKIMNGTTLLSTSFMSLASSRMLIAVVLKKLPKIKHCFSGMHFAGC
uniref:Uncharacterized protein n=1 Tax=Arundo donax TaxID=35708 RepID=A0A0A9FJB8_ARUDO